MLRRGPPAPRTPHAGGQSRAAAGAVVDELDPAAPASGALDVVVPESPAPPGALVDVDDAGRASSRTPCQSAPVTRTSPALPATGSRSAPETSHRDTRSACAARSDGYCTTVRS